MYDRAISQILTTVQFVTIPEGQRLAVLDADVWEELMEWLMYLEDKRIVQQSLARLRAGPEASGALLLEDVLDEL